MKLWEPILIITAIGTAGNLAVALGWSAWRRLRQRRFGEG